MLQTTEKTLVADLQSLSVELRIMSWIFLLDHLSLLLWAVFILCWQSTAHWCITQHTTQHSLIIHSHPCKHSSIHDHFHNLFTTNTNLLLRSILDNELKQHQRMGELASIWVCKFLWKQSLTGPIFNYYTDTYPLAMTNLLLTDTVISIWI